jgi:hypothetical protein
MSTLVPLPWSSVDASVGKRRATPSCKPGAKSVLGCDLPCRAKALLQAHAMSHSAAHTADTFTQEGTDMRSASIDSIVFTIVVVSAFIGLMADSLRGWLLW